MPSLWFIGGAQRSQLSTQYHARPTYLKPGQIVSQQIKLNGEGQYLSVQIHQDSSLKVSPHDQQNGQTWYLKRRGVHIDYLDQLSDQGCQSDQSKTADCNLEDRSLPNGRYVFNQSNN